MLQAALLEVATNANLLGKAADSGKIQVRAVRWLFISDSNPIARMYCTVFNFSTCYWQVWARTEGDLIRALVSYSLERSRRNFDTKSDSELAVVMLE